MQNADPEGFSRTALDHARSPRNPGPLREFNGHVRITGPCGDTMEFWVMVRGGVVARVGFATDGCRSSVACGSMAAHLGRGQPVDVVVTLTPRQILDALGGVPRKAEHCALLAVDTLKAACADYLKNITETPRRATTASRDEEIPA